MCTKNAFLYSYVNLTQSSSKSCVSTISHCQQPIIPFYILLTQINATESILKLKITNLCVQICKYLVNLANKSHRSIHFLRNRSPLRNTTNIHTGISQLLQVGLTLSHFLVKACGLVPHLERCGFAIFIAFGVVALWK